MKRNIPRMKNWHNTRESKNNVHCNLSLTDLRITKIGRIELFSEKKDYFYVLKGASESSVNKDNTMMTILLA